MNSTIGKYIVFFRDAAHTRHPKISAFLDRLRQAIIDPQIILTEGQELFLSSWIEQIMTKGESEDYSKIAEVAKYINGLAQPKINPWMRR